MEKKKEKRKGKDSLLRSFPHLLNRPPIVSTSVFVLFNVVNMFRHVPGRDDRHGPRHLAKRKERGEGGEKKEREVVSEQRAHV